MRFTRTVPVFAVLILLAGCSSQQTEQKEKAESPGSAKVDPEKAEAPEPIVFTEKSEKALRKLSADGLGPWVIFSQGLCDGKPAIGIYEAKDNPPKGGSRLTVRGIDFILDEDMPGLMKKHGAILLDGPVSKDGGFTAALVNPK